jgi:2-hydroxycyclohexanecarboxyl-CoA dehydrogenase
VSVAPPALAVVTGAGRGIGRATVLAFAAKGTAVVCADVDGEAAEATARDCRALGVDAAVHEVDVADRAAVADFAEAVVAGHGAPDVLVNNAGVGLSGPLTETDLADWARMARINIDGVVNGCHAFGPSMLARGSGQVVNLSSGLAYTYSPTEWGYVTAKAAVLAFSRSLRADWRPRGVGVTAVCPGVIDTGILGRTRFAGSGADEDRTTRLHQVFRRGHPPSRVADAIVEAVRRDPVVLPVGREARLGWWFARVAPVRSQQWLAGRMP